MFSRIVRNVSEQMVNLVKDQIKIHPVLVYSKGYCPYCTRAKNTLTNLQVEFKVFELDSMKEGNDIFEALVKLTKQETVPNIFISGNHIGGSSDLLEGLKSGKIQELLKQNQIKFKEI